MFILEKQKIPLNLCRNSLRDIFYRMIYGGLKGFKKTKTLEILKSLLRMCLNRVP